MKKARMISNYENSEELSLVLVQWTPPKYLIWCWTHQHYLIWCWTPPKLFNLVLDPPKFFTSVWDPATILYFCVTWFETETTPEIVHMVALKLKLSFANLGCTEAFSFAMWDTHI